MAIIQDSLECKGHQTSHVFLIALPSVVKKYSPSLAGIASRQISPRDSILLNWRQAKAHSTNHFRSQSLRLAVYSAS